MIEFKCMTCQQAISVPDAYRAKRVRCGKCHSAVLVPMRTAAAAAAQEAPAPIETAPAARPATPAPAPATPTPPPTDGPLPDQEESSVLALLVDHIRASKAAIVTGGLITLLGVAWLLDAIGYLPDIGWVWAFGLFATGVLALVLGGLNKQTCVVGPFLMICGIFSILRQKGIVTLRVEVPSLVIAFGLLVLIVAVLGFNLPDVIEDGRPRKKS